MTTTRDYYQKAKKSSLDFSHPGLKLLRQSAKKAKKILEVGCGEGTKLNKIGFKESIAYGVDISSLAIKLAKKQYPHQKFIKANAVKLSFKDGYFDFVYSAFSLEHLKQPKLAIIEMIRVCKPNGKLAFIAPNFGAPNRASPCYQKSRVKKLIGGFLLDLFIKSSKLNWENVKPIATKNKWKMDWDTRVEPYLLSLKRFLESRGLKVLKYSSFWQIKQKKEPFYQQIFKRLGLMGVYPFSYWGPHLFIIAEKKV